MALWSKKKEESVRVLEFNKGKLQEEIENLSSHLTKHKEDITLKIFEELLQLARNVEILDVGLYKTEQDLHIHKGRLAAFSDLISYIERAKAFDPKEEKQGRARDTVSIKPRSSTLAGAAV